MFDLSTFELIIIGLGLAAVAFLYSSVGHAGASGYIAVMSLANLPVEQMRPVVLMLNILVATIATWQFASRGHLNWRLFWPFALLAVPMAFLGGYLALPSQYLQLLLGWVLLFSAVRLLLNGSPEEQTIRQPPLWIALPTGGALGLVAGLSGTGGGIFLTPLLLFARWANTRQAAGVSAAFILLNSLAGLSGHIIQSSQFPAVAITWAPLVMVAGFAGSFMGSHKYRGITIKRLLSIVLTIAGGKLLLTSI